MTDKKPEWTHRICERCWFDGPPQMIHSVPCYDAPPHEIVGMIQDGEHAGAYRQPVQVNLDEPKPGACCFCGGMTITRIFVRYDPADATVLCEGEHENIAGWSRVGLV